MGLDWISWENYFYFSISIVNLQLPVWRLNWAFVLYSGSRASITENRREIGGKDQNLIKAKGNVNIQLWSECQVECWKALYA